MQPDPQKTYHIRHARVEDASALIRFVQTIAAEPRIYIGLTEGEFTFTVEQEEAFISNIIQADNSAMLVADSGGDIIGSLTLQGGNRKSTRHTAMLGISIAQDWRNQGVGHALMQASLDFARQSGVLQRIELNVATENLPAIHLYLKFGFVVEGKRRRALFRDGRFYDNYLMALLLEA